MAPSLHIPKRVIDIRIGEASGVARSFVESDCGFNVKWWMSKKPNEAKAKIYNLSPSTINSLERPGLVLYVNAGLDVAGQLFRGAISEDGVNTTSSGPDWITEIDAADGRRAYRDTTFSESYPAGYPVIKMINAIAAAMGKPLTISSTISAPVLAQLNSVNSPTAWTFSELAAAAMDRVLGPFGLSWGIISGVNYIFDPFVALPGNAPLVTPDSTLHGSPKRTKKGIRFTSELDPRIQPGRGVVVQSRMVSGTYIAQEGSHEGEDRTPKWITQCHGRKV